MPRTVGHQRPASTVLSRSTGSVGGTGTTCRGRLRPPARRHLCLSAARVPPISPFRLPLLPRPAARHGSKPTADPRLELGDEGVARQRATGPGGFTQSLDDPLVFGFGGLAEERLPHLGRMAGGPAVGVDQFATVQA